MSNHDGSYMLNEVLQYLEDDHTTSLGHAFRSMLALGHAFRSMLAKDRAKFFNDILKIGRRHDCNDGEILKHPLIFYQSVEFEKLLPLFIASINARNSTSSWYLGSQEEKWSFSNVSRNSFGIWSATFFIMVSQTHKR